MIKVYFATNVHTEFVALFIDELSYMAAFPGLMKRAEQNGMWIVESKVDDINELFKEL